MISTSGILSTGEKKCRPMKLAGRADASASPLMGRVEVLEAKMAPGAITASALRVTSALMARSSNTASTTMSQPARSAKSVVGLIRVSLASRSASVMRLAATRLFHRFSL
ncbi:hypothetical protein Y695_03654 [Hydrogenophaga sp. T4]|nr:hypothetical protein Y695_03654 [Hydrogenophaga sp. T4]